MARAPESSAPGMTLPAQSPTGDREMAAGVVGEALRRARQHRGWSLREVERRTGRPNAYLSQIERGVIRQPDPAVVWQLAQLYGLNFDLLARWSGLEVRERDHPSDDVIGKIIKLVLNLKPEQRVRALAYLEQLSREDRT